MWNMQFYSNKSTGPIIRSIQFFIHSTFDWKATTFHQIFVEKNISFKTVEKSIIPKI